MSTSHIVVSHGADFFGEDRHPLQSVTALAGYAEGCLPAATRAPLVQLLAHPAEVVTLPPVAAAGFAPLLLTLSRHRFLKGKPAAVARALADAAARAVEAGEPWGWRIEAA